MVFLIPVALSYGVDPGGGGPKPDRAKKEGNGPKEAGGDGIKVNKGPREKQSGGERQKKKGKQAKGKPEKEAN